MCLGRKENFLVCRFPAPSFFVILRKTPQKVLALPFSPVYKPHTFVPKIESGGASLYGNELSLSPNTWKPPKNVYFGVRLAHGYDLHWVDTVFFAQTVILILQPFRAKWRNSCVNRKTWIKIILNKKFQEFFWECTNVLLFLFLFSRGCGNRARSLFGTLGTKGFSTENSQIMIHNSVSLCPNTLWVVEMFTYAQTVFKNKAMSNRTMNLETFQTCTHVLWISHLSVPRSKLKLRRTWTQHAKSTNSDTPRSQDGSAWSNTSVASSDMKADQQFVHLQQRGALTHRPHRWREWWRWDCPWPCSSCTCRWSRELQRSSRRGHRPSTRPSLRRTILKNKNETKFSRSFFLRTNGIQQISFRENVCSSFCAARSHKKKEQ